MHLSHYRYDNLSAMRRPSIQSFLLSFLLQIGVQHAALTKGRISAHINFLTHNIAKVLKVVRKQVYHRIDHISGGGTGQTFGSDYFVCDIYKEK